MKLFVRSIIFFLLFFVFTPKSLATYRVGVNYHQTGQDINNTTFIRQYHNPEVRNLVKKQLQDMANSGTEVINTRLWLTDPDPNRFPNIYQRLPFPLTTQDLANIRQYTQDVALIKNQAGKHLDLYFTLLWQGCADYAEGYSKWCSYSWDQFVYYAKYSIDGFFGSIKDLTRPDGKKAVELAYFDGEVIIEKNNTDKMLTQVYSYFVTEANKAGIKPTIYFMINRDGTLDRFLIPTLDFMKNNNLYIPPRIDISFYPIPGWPSSRLETGYGPLIENTFVSLQNAYPNNKFAIAETYYPSNPTARREIGQAYASVATKYNKLEELLIWPYFDTNDAVWDSPHPYDVRSYLPATPTGTITASPNPCVVGTNGTCTTIISWTSSNASQPSIYVGTTLFAQAVSGSQQTWALPLGSSYTLTLYDKPGGNALNSVVVSASNSGFKPGDLNADGKVDVFDYNLLISKFGNPYTIFDYNNVVTNYDK